MINTPLEWSDVENHSAADDLIRLKNKLSENLNSRDAITVQELKECQNLNPYKEWLINLLVDANALTSSIDDDFVHEIGVLEMAQDRLHNMLDLNQELERKNQAL